ncbi:MAG: DUF4091 domain-containing protein [Candidatus Methylomirabilis oxygeniifera]|uniref:Glycoside hydrolase 123 C-terminal domain-containing protein n=1 Tax=Methylomirabilis oxygeniifera TaxID=671143 RepID=D5MIG6_METO1|nr:MAG: DUF4091 domain-containing protein [Candidatus Methylomirabilis oxyfera]CBE67316.1 conserved exported protein of unknown function [Candidatus Methylomirabilis oxyfera]
MKTTVAVALALTLSFTGIVGNHAEAAKARPDLIVAAVSAPSSTSPNTIIVVSGTIKNQGRASSKAFNVAAYLSADPSNTIGATLLGTQNVSGLAAGASVALSNSFTVPASTASGTFYVVAVADSTKVVSESNESNNTRASGGIAVQAPISTPTAAQITAWVTDSLARIQPTDPAGISTEATIKAARNEYEGFQVIVKAPSDTALSNVTATASDLTGPTGVIASSNITLYREAYILVTTSSPASPYPTGWWPDPLIPFKHPETGANLGQPFTVDAGRNVPIYVEVYVPAGTPAGTYTGGIQVSVSGGASIPIPISLTVWNFSLPTTPALRTNFGHFRSQQFAAAFGTSRYTDIHNTLMDKFDHELLRHRLSPARPSGTEPSYNAATGTIDSSNVQARMAHFISLGLTSYDLPLFDDWPWADPFGADRDKAQRYLSGILDWLGANDWLTLAYHDGIDEPEEASGYQAVRDEATNWHGLDPRAKMLITEQTRPWDPTWGTLYGSVDIWTPYFSRFDPVTWAERRAVGEQSWMYGAWGDNGTPGDLLDRPIYEIRVPAWIGFQYGITGLLKWNTVYWDQVTDPWTNPATYTLSGDIFNGDGAFFYPGTKVGYEGPIASLRLKTFRDAVDDYDYLTQLAVTDPASAQAIAQRVGTTFTDWTKDSTPIAQARLELGRRLGEL